MNLRPLLIIPPLVLAGVVFVWMNQMTEEETPVSEASGLTVRVMTVEPGTVQATAIGYGRVQPVRQWSAVAEVSGRIVGMKDDLAVGSVVEKGDILLEIDRADYELARSKARSNISSVEAQINELARQEENTRKTLEVERELFRIAEAEYNRVISLVDRGTSTQANLDNALKAFLKQKTSLTNLENTLALYPDRRQTLEATLEIRKADLRDAERSIEKATIAAPFRGRVSAQKAEKGQFARNGDTLLSLDDISAVEITAEVQPKSFAPLISVAFSDRSGQDTGVDAARAIEILHNIGLKAEVGTPMTGLSATWPAEIVRMRGTMDNDTGSLGLVVRVEDPTISQKPLTRPPLSVGAFVDVTFTTRPVDNLLVVPRNAVRYDIDGNPFVYLADPDNRLIRQDIRTGAVIQSDLQVLEGLSGGETLVLSDPQPPVLGISLNLVTQDKDR